MITRQQLQAAVRLARRGLIDLNVFVRSLASEYVSAQAAVEAAIMGALLKGDIVTVRQRTEHLRKIRLVLRQLGETSPQKSRQLMKESYRLGERVTINATGERRDHGRIRQTAVDILADNLENRLRDARVVVGRRTDDVFRREGLRAALIATASDTEDVQVAAAGMRERLLKQGVTAFVDSRGAHWRLDTYAEMTIRTNVTDALAMGTRDTLLARDFDLVEIHSGESACPKCQPYLGQTWSLTGRSKKYKKLPAEPSYHPKCDCVMTPSEHAFDEREEWQEEAMAA